MKKFLAVILAVLACAALGGCEKNLEKIINAEVLSEAENQLNCESDDTVGFKLTAQENTVFINAYFTEESGIVKDNFTEEYLDFNRDSFEKLAKETAEKIVADGECYASLKQNEIESVTFQINYYDYEGEILWSGEFPVGIDDM